MKNIMSIISVTLLLVIISCNKDDTKWRMQHSLKGESDNPGCNIRKLKIAVLSDLHFMDPSLLKSDGSAFQTYLMQDPKLLAESGAILQQIIHKLIEEKPDLVLISGDMTKDGELVSHRSLIKQLKQLEMNHIKVLVVPGNHDINNPDAMQFNGDNVSPVTTVTPEEFRSLYADYGYRNAIAKDQGSLSYVFEPFKGLRILALDANEYYNNTENYCVVSGKIKDETMEWAKQQLGEAKARGIKVIGLMHHGIVEHFTGESLIFPDYLVDNYNVRAGELLQAGLKVIFTGHFHANDATGMTIGDQSLIDIETGSPVIYDSPYRIINLSDNKLYINTKHIEYINYKGLNGVSFHEYEKSFSLKGFEIQATYMLTNPPYNMPKDMATQVSPLFAEAMLSHFAGDETLSAETYLKIEEISAVSSDLGNILLGLYSDLLPGDNDLVVDLN